MIDSNEKCVGKLKIQAVCGQFSDMYILMWCKSWSDASVFDCAKFRTMCFLNFGEIQEGGSVVASMYGSKYHKSLYDVLVVVWLRAFVWFHLAGVFCYEYSWNPRVR